jgi:hypothetical protein
MFEQRDLAWVSGVDAAVEEGGHVSGVGADATGPERLVPDVEELAKLPVETKTPVGIFVPPRGGAMPMP